MPDARTDEPKRQQTNPHEAEGLFRWRKDVLSKSTYVEPIQKKWISAGRRSALYKKKSGLLVRKYFLLSLILSSALLANSVVKAELRKVTLSYSAVSMTWFPVKVAVEKGFLRNEGLEPQLIQMNGNVATVALANGHIDFSLNISPVLNGANQGLGLKLVTALNTRPLFSLVVRPEVQSPVDLKGEVFAVSSFGNTQAILTEKHLQHLGLKKGEYQLLAMGATPARIAAMEKNIVQGSLMPLPTNVQMENRGYRILGNTAEIITHPIAGLGVHEDKIKKDPDLIKRTIRASLRSLQLLQTNPKETLKILMDWGRASEKDALRSLELAKPGFSKNGFLTDDDLSIEWSFIQQQTKKTHVPVSIAHDMTLLKEVQRELGMQ
jgi:NitT/TauT family transport system substrate-binding protein